jgi:hypothetical protein
VNISCKSAEGTQKGAGKMSVSTDSYLGRAEVEQQKKVPDRSSWRRRIPASGCRPAADPA